jgi:hypothetical protein
LENAAPCATGVTASNTVEATVAAASGAAFTGARRGVLLVAAGGGGVGGARVADTDVGTMAAPAECYSSLPTRARCSFGHTSASSRQVRW